MDIMQTLINALILGAVGTVLAWMVQGLRKEVRQDIAVLRQDIAVLRQEIAAVRQEMREEVRGLRSDLTQVALAVGAGPRAQNG